MGFPVFSSCEFRRIMFFACGVCQVQFISNTHCLTELVSFMLSHLDIKLLLFYKMSSVLRQAVFDG